MRKLFKRDIPYELEEKTYDEDGEIEDLWKIVMIPPSLRNKYIERDVYVLFGKSGSGKSTSIRELLELYRGYNLAEGKPRPKVFVITNVESSANFGSDAVYIDIETMYELVPIRGFGSSVVPKIPTEDFERMFRDSIVVFDDYDTGTSRHIEKLIYFFRNKLLQEGRHLRANMILGQHEALRGDKDKLVKTEATVYNFFQDMLPGALERLLKVYVGVDKEDIRTLTRELYTRPRQRITIGLGDRLLLSYDKIWEITIPSS